MLTLTAGNPAGPHPQSAKRTTCIVMTRLGSRIRDDSSDPFARAHLRLREGHFDLKALSELRIIAEPRFYCYQLLIRDFACYGTNSCNCPLSISHI